MLLFRGQCSLVQWVIVALFSGGKRPQHPLDELAALPHRDIAFEPPDKRVRKMDQQLRGGPSEVSLILNINIYILRYSRPVEVTAFCIRRYAMIGSAGGGYETAGRTASCRDPAADVAGYSRLMGADEEGTHERSRRIAENSSIQDQRASRPIVKTTGDGMLVEFASVVDAVRCAVEVQRAMVERNADMPETGASLSASASILAT